MKKFVAPSPDEIACCAFAIIARENPQLASHKWQEAEAQLTAVRKHDAGLLPKRIRSSSSSLHSLQAVA